MHGSVLIEALTYASIFWREEIKPVPPGSAPHRLDAMVREPDLILPPGSARTWAIPCSKPFLRPGPAVLDVAIPPMLFTHPQGRKQPAACSAEIPCRALPPMELMAQQGVRIEATVGKDGSFQDYPAVLRLAVTCDPAKLSGRTVLREMPMMAWTGQDGKVLRYVHQPTGAQVETALSPEEPSAVLCWAVGNLRPTLGSGPGPFTAQLRFRQFLSGSATQAAYPSKNEKAWALMQDYGLALDSPEIRGRFGFLPAPSPKLRDPALPLPLPGLWLAFDLTLRGAFDDKGWPTGPFQVTLGP